MMDGYPHKVGRGLPADVEVLFRDLDEVDYDIKTWKSNFHVDVGHGFCDRLFVAGGVEPVGDIETMKGH